MRAAGTMVVLLVCLCGRLLPGAEAADPGALIAAAEKANVAGDKIAALKGFAEAANALRTSGAPQAKIDGCVAEKDRLMVGLLAEMQKQQIEVVQLQRGVSQRIVKIAQTDEDIQARTRKNEDKIKDIEALLLGALK